MWPVCIPIAKAALNSTSIAWASAVLPPEQDARFDTHANYETFWRHSFQGISFLFLMFRETAGEV